MEYIVLSLVLIIAVCAAGAIWKAYDIDMDELEEDDEDRKET